VTGVQPTMSVSLAERYRIERFVVEIKTTAALQHPHILPLFDSGTADGQLFYVMPYVQGDTIREKLNRERQFGIEEAVRITREVADALDYAHRHGVIHRRHFHCRRIPPVATRPTICRISDRTACNTGTFRAWRTARSTLALGVWQG
jgi:hypothetical protein